MPEKKKSKNATAGLQQENILEAVVIADSFNTRFLPITAHRPRSLFPLANQPILSYTLEFLSSCGVKQIYVYCCHCADQVRDFLEKSKWSKSTSSCVVTPIISCDFTSVGDVLRDVDQKSLFESDFLLIPGDVISNVELNHVLEEHRIRREKDKNVPLMTLLLQQSSPAHQSRSPEDDIIIAADKQTQRVLHYQKIRNNCKKVHLPLSLFSSPSSTVEIRYDLVDTGIWVCSPQVPQLFTDNFDYQTQFDFIKGVLINEEFLGNQIHMHVNKSLYCARVQNLHSYDVASRDVISRWTYPLVPEIIFNEISSDSKGIGEGYKLLRHNVYLHTTCVLGHGSIVADNSIIGKGTTIGERCRITNAVIGNACRIGNDCVISGSYVWNNVTIEEKCKISRSVVCDGVTILDSVSLRQGCVLCDEVCVGPNITLADETVVYLHGDDDEFEDDVDKKAFAVEVGSKGKGYIWRKSDESDVESDSSLVQHFWGLSLQEQTKVFAEAIEDDVSESEASSLGISEDEDEHQDVVDDDFSSFQREVKESLQGGFMEKAQCDNLILEVNSSKYAYNVGMRDVVQTVTKSLFEIAAVVAADEKSQFYPAMKKILEHFVPLLCNYNKNEASQLDCLYAIEEHAASHENVANCLIKVMMFLYDNDVVSEAAVLRWNSNPDVSYLAVYTPQQIRTKVAKFIQWLNEAEEEDSDD